MSILAFFIYYLNGYFFICLNKTRLYLILIYVGTKKNICMYGVIHCIFDLFTSQHFMKKKKRENLQNQLCLANSRTCRCSKRGKGNKSPVPFAAQKEREVFCGFFLKQKIRIT